MLNESELGDADGEAEASGDDGEDDDDEAGGSNVEGEESEPDIPDNGDNHNEAVHESPDAPNDDDDDVNDFDDGTTLVLGGADGEAPGADVARVSDLEEGCDLEGMFFQEGLVRKKVTLGKWNTALLCISDF